MNLQNLCGLIQRKGSQLFLMTCRAMAARQRKHRAVSTSWQVPQQEKESLITPRVSKRTNNESNSQINPRIHRFELCVYVFSEGQCDRESDWLRPRASLTQWEPIGAAARRGRCVVWLRHHLLSLSGSSCELESVWQLQPSPPPLRPDRHTDIPPAALPPRANTSPRSLHSLLLF